MENSAAYLEVAWAAQRSGLYYTALNSHLRSAEVQYILDDCGATALVTTPGHGRRRRQPRPDACPGAAVGRGRLPGFSDYEATVAAFAPVADRRRVRGARDALLVGDHGSAQGRAQGAAPHPDGGPVGRPGPDRPGTGTPWRGPGSVYLSPAPLYHSAPLVYCMSMLRLGATVVVMEHFDPARCLELIERHGVTHAQFVPTMFVRMLRLPETSGRGHDLSSLRSVVHAAAPCPVAVKRQMLEWWGPIIDEYYAGTEDIGSTWITAAEWLAHPGSVGRPLSPAHVVGPDGRGARAPARRASSTSRGAGPSSTTTTRRRRRRWSTPGDGAPSGTSGCSTRTATCISPTARRT